ncbi:MAG: MmcQ/YjbR family DNA-binding protein [Thermomicrobiales bacterium]
MAEHPRITVDDTIMRRMRAICKRLPEATEAEAFGAPTFQIRTKNFAMLHRPEQGTSVWCKAVPGFQEALIERDPVHYFRPPYLGPKGWIAAWLDEAIDPDWDEIEEMVIESYRLIAPKRLVAALDRE